MIGRLFTTDADATSRTLEIALTDEPFKGPASAPGERRRYTTELESATCGVPAEPGAVYILFGQEREGDTRTWIDTCSGSRIQLSRSNPDPVGFDDVPARFVVQQLLGFAGAETLRAVAANAPKRNDAANDTLIGLLKIPALEAGGSVALYAEPNAGAQSTRTTSFAPLATREYGYEQPGAVVVAEVAAWYRVPLAADASVAGLGVPGPTQQGASAARYAWVRAADGELLRYPELVVNRLNYLNEHWDGFLWPSPGAGLPVRIRRDPNARSEQEARVLEVTEIGGMPFLRVELTQGACEGGEPRVREGGWVPAYGASGEPVAWFHSRGC